MWFTMMQKQKIFSLISSPALIKTFTRIIEKVGALLALFVNIVNIRNLPVGGINLVHT